MEQSEFNKLMIGFFGGIRTMENSEITTRSNVKLLIFSTSAGAGQQMAKVDANTFLNAVKSADLGYKTVQMNITQSSTDPPDLTEIVDDSSAVYTPAYSAVGIYTVTADSGVFAADTVAQIALGAGTAGTANAYRLNSTTIRIFTFDAAGAAADGILDVNAQLLIKIPT